jgi:5-methylcytosine-specific restriction enzyme subunit McrC
VTEITLTEYADATLPLSDADVALLHGRLDTWFNVRPSMRGGAFEVNPGSTVGVIRLPSGTQLQLLPKVPLRNLLWMISAACDVPREMFDDAVAITRFDQLIEIVADVFSRMVEERIDLGLYRNYVEEEANLPTVRGRILIAEDLHQNTVLRHRTFCRFTTYSWDLPENQIIRHVVHLLSGWGLSRKLTGRLLALDSQLDEIERVSFRAVDVDRFTYNRQSVDYQPIHRLCQLFLEGASLSEEAGNVAFDGFLLDMNVLFERFITRALRERLVYPLSLRDQLNVTLDVDEQVQMRPDLVVSNGGAHVLAADCKYKRLETDQHKNHDLYQLVSYCTALEVGNGMLIYPRHLVDIASTMHIRGATMSIQELTIDLGGSLVDINRDLDALAGHVQITSVRAELDVAS